MNSAGRQPPYPLAQRVEHRAGRVQFEEYTHPHGLLQDLRLPVDHYLSLMM